MSVQIRCDVCFESFTLDMFRFLPVCGHGLCIPCSEKTATGRNCAICRHPKGFQQPVQIFLTFAADSNPADKVHAMIDNIARIDVDSAPISVQKAGRKIRHAARDLEPQDNVARELLDAAKNLEKRIHPVFLELSLANDRIAALTAEIDELRLQLGVAESLEEQLKQTRQSVVRANRETKAARGEEARANEMVLKERADNSRLRSTVQRQLSELSTKGDQNDVLRAKLARRDNRISLLEKKLKLVSRTVKHPKPDAYDPNESLQIDNSAEGIRVPRKSNDWLARIRATPKGSGAFVKRTQTLPDIELS
ncbi:hypothetical protein B0H15DRAFT_1023653 [Mycena belliarum]|uniref:RING-type domain-containing protein n=1 Tax=Mycena belliarum TaxID=1033014 RepID=A0AAD6TZT8_9AGAR|nr:hypothetical protein B0H15DRAFT_1023653 [Mycena belliae]